MTLDIQPLVEEYKKEFREKYPKYFETHYTKSLAIVSILDKNNLVDQGISKVNDLLLDNWGNFLNGVLAQQSFPQVVISGTPRSCNVLSASNSYNMNAGDVAGTQLAIGSGTTLADRQDFKLQTQIGSQFNIAGVGGWNSGLGQISVTGSFVATSGNTINEVGIMNRWRNTVTDEFSLISHDNISPVAFINGQTVTVNYIFLLS